MQGFWCPFLRPTIPALALCLLIAPASAQAQTTLNLSHDLTTLGVTGTNMVPNQPSLDAGPLFVAGVEYAKAHDIA